MKSLIERAVRERAVVERVLRGFAAAILLTMADMGFAQNAIEGFNVTQQGGQILVQITTKAPLRETPANMPVGL